MTVFFNLLWLQSLENFKKFLMFLNETLFLTCIQIYLFLCLPSDCRDFYFQVHGTIVNIPCVASEFPISSFNEICALDHGSVQVHLGDGNIHFIQPQLCYLVLSLHYVLLNRRWKYRVL